MKPKFSHDCLRCIFLGHFRDHDVYYCVNEAFSSETGGSLIARHDMTLHDRPIHFLEYIGGPEKGSAMAAVYDALYPESKEE